jgi:uncharacterized membrane-anchored protein YhcB (DUF1043 family)
MKWEHVADGFLSWQLPVALVIGVVVGIALAKLGGRS